eukprot:506519-Rhodomonas_salina.1
MVGGDTRVPGHAMMGGEKKWLQNLTAVRRSRCISRLFNLQSLTPGGNCFRNRLVFKTLACHPENPCSRVPGPRRVVRA